MRKKRRVSIWLLPIVAIIGMIGFLANVNGNPHKRKTKKQQVRNFKTTPKSDYDVEMQLIADLEEPQLTSR